MVGLSTLHAFLCGFVFALARQFMLYRLHYEINDYVGLVLSKDKVEP